MVKTTGRTEVWVEETGRSGEIPTVEKCILGALFGAGYT